MPGGQQEPAPAGRRRGGATAVGVSARPHPGEKWLTEARRGYAAIALAILLTLPVPLIIDSTVAWGDSTVTELSLFMVAAYLCLYIAITGLVFLLTPAERYLPWAESSREGTWVQHYLMGTHPGPGTAQAVSAFALTLGVFWYPTTQGDSALPGWATGVLVAGIVVTAWLTVVMTYSVAYLMQDARSGYQQLEFPGDGPRRWTDYFYFSAAVSTAFASPDVAIRTARMRRTVTGHSILAFGFNTVILAAVVSVLIR